MLVEPNNPNNLYFPAIDTVSIFGINPTATLQDGILVSSVNGSLFDVYLRNTRIFRVGGNGFNIDSGNWGETMRRCGLMVSMQKSVNRMESCNRKEI